MTIPLHDLLFLKSKGIIPQKQKGLYVLRLRTVAGDLTADELVSIATLASQFGQARIHVTTRQGIEIHNVAEHELEGALEEVNKAQLRLGIAGPRLRTITACPGSETCKWGHVNPKPLAHTLDSAYFGTELPYKFKIAVTGCAHNCAKANENDFGIMGAVLPEWHGKNCSDCQLCMSQCPTKAIVRTEAPLNHPKARYEFSEDKCINCGRCVVTCPQKAWHTAQHGLTVFVGGTMATKPRLGNVLKRFMTQEEALKILDRALHLYRIEGKKRERFGHMIDRLGFETVKRILLEGETTQKTSP